VIRIETGSRIHFGLIEVPSLYTHSMSPVAAGAFPRRHFGGVGLMVQQPGVRLRLEPAASWSVQGPLAERAWDFMQRCLQGLRCRGGPLPAPQRLVVESAPPEHVGLGTGTQLGLAVGRAVSAAAGLEVPVAELACWLGRGARSALGVHGFAQGGLLVDAGKRHPQGLAPLVARLPFPADWPVLLITPAATSGLFGKLEEEAFRRLANYPPQPARTDALCRLILFGLLPAVAEHDWRTCGEALYEINRLAGEIFRPVQGGLYAHPQAEALVTFLRQQGVPGAGQSSWGPTLFAVTAEPSQAEYLCRRLQTHFALEADALRITTAANSGARLTGAERTSPDLSPAEGHSSEGAPP
jgi:beta-ribofuranosylaminobenzene 5'-phosphate synthase